jgi:NADH-quinone oxidoreductase subunit N
MLNDLFILMKSELLLTAIIFILLFLKLSSSNIQNKSVIQLVHIFLFINVVAGFFYNNSGSLFGDMYATNPLLQFEKNILNIGVFIISLQSTQWLTKHEHTLEFYILLLSTLLGMYFMISAGNMLMFYLALELSTIPLAALANFDLHKKHSAEAAMKLIISSAFSSGLLLLGISFLYGSIGTLNFVEIQTLLTGNSLELFAFVLIISGFCFKISAVPFHLWTADVYEGAPIAVTAYLSVISKAAITFVFTSVLYYVFSSMSNEWYHVLFIISILTMLIGNLFALRQESMKRFLAFSSIAQVGFILIGITGQSIDGSSSVIYFVLIYIFSNLGAFGVVALVSALTNKENIEDYKGFYKTNPMLTWILTISLFSLAGIPPTAGFFGKFFLLMSGAGKGNYVLIIIASLNMVISLFYYLKIVKAMFMDKNETPIQKISIPISENISFAICMLGILITGLVSGIYQYIFSLQ